MKRIRVAVLAGIRSHYMKLAAFQRVAERFCLANPNMFDFIYIDAAQHYDYQLAGGFIDELNVKFNERIKYDAKNPIDVFGEMYKHLSYFLQQEHTQNPIDYFIVFGDANTTAVGAIAANKQRIPLVHVEAGLRLGTFNGPEESNSVIADHLSTVCCASSFHTFDNLKREGIEERSVFTGDIVYDLIKEFSGLATGNEIYYVAKGKNHVFNKNAFIVAEMHREENLRNGVLPTYIKTLERTGRPIFFLAHKRVVVMLNDLEFDREQIVVADFVSYINTLRAIKNCAYLMTDSGTLPREANFLGKRALIRQNPPYWPVLAEKGIHKLIGTSFDEIWEGISWIEKMKEVTVPKIDDFGDGNAVKNILMHLAGKHI